MCERRRPGPGGLRLPAQGARVPASPRALHHRRHRRKPTHVAGTSMADVSAMMKKPPSGATGLSPADASPAIRMSRLRVYSERSHA
jgi:hypothetical protein